jgi:hypothetical protein
MKCKVSKKQFVIVGFKNAVLTRVLSYAGYQSPMQLGFASCLFRVVIGCS